MKKLIIISLLIFVGMGLISCDKFLNVVPDDTATIKKSFIKQQQAKQFLYTLYSYLPAAGFSDRGFGVFPGFGSSQEFIGSRPYQPHKIMKGLQKVVNPYLNFWEGRNGGNNLYEAIRKCNIFLKNIHKVTNMTKVKKDRWAAEAKFLKAYYYFFLTRMYGPVVLYKHNVPISAPKSEIDQTRAPIDSTFSYIIKLLNEVIHTPELPARISNRQKNLGRIDKSIAYAIKAKVEVYAASPLFNGNESYKAFKNKKGIDPFDTKYDPAKWDSAAHASKVAIDYLTAHNFKLYHFVPSVLTAGLSDTTLQELTIRNSVALGQNKINSGVIWYRPSIPDYSSDFYRRQSYNIPRGLNHANPANGLAEGCQAPPLKIVEMFYTNHGVPINQDTSWDYADRFKVRTVKQNQRFHLTLGYKTAYLNMYRGPRFYADLAFDGSVWYGNGKYKGGPANFHHIKARHGQINSFSTHENIFYSKTGYWVKKLVNWRTQLDDQGYGGTINYYNWPIMRLADLYLLYAEAKNEADGPGPEVYKYLNLVRERVGLPTVQKAWSTWSDHPNQYKTKKGLRKIIHHERLIELAFEGKRFWALRRWKEAPQYLNRPVKGWSRSFSKAKSYYKPKILFYPHFSKKDYFWPISEKELFRNPMLTQNPGWGR